MRGRERAYIDVWAGDESADVGSAAAAAADGDQHQVWWKYVGDVSGAELSPDGR
jgi:hypothetical protein